MVRGKHRLPTPVKLVAAAAAVLTIGGIVVAAGSAAADSNRAAARAEERKGRADCRVGQSFSRSGAWTTLRGEPLYINQIATFTVAPGEERLTNISQRDDGNGGNSRRNCNGGKQDGDLNGNGENDGNNENQQFPGRDQAGGPARNDFIKIQDVPPNVAEPEPGSGASTGSFTSVCGTNEEGHRNSDNFMVAPGKVNGAQHVHDYVGNLSTDAFSNDESLAAADTTCAKGDQSTYFWPVLRNTKKKGDDAKEDGGGLDGNVGEILDPATVELTFQGNPQDSVTAMPENLSVITGDAKAGTNGNANAKAAWTCTGFENRVTTKYPLCPRGSQLMRILEFPSCWDGENLDSANHRTHIVFPGADGSCQGGTVAVPQLQMTLIYDQPRDRNFALDTFPDQRHNPLTDHADFMNLMPDGLMAEAVNCINSGRDC